MFVYNSHVIKLQSVRCPWCKISLTPSPHWRL